MPASWSQIKSKSEKLRHLISFKKSSFDVFFSAGTADLDLALLLGSKKYRFEFNMSLINHVSGLGTYMALDSCKPSM